MLLFRTLVGIHGLLLTAAPVFAFQLDYGASLGGRYTDNVGLVDTRERADWILMADVGANLKQKSGKLDTDISTTLSYQDYLRNNFSNQFYFDLGARTSWQVIGRNLVWNIENYFTQQKVDSVDAVTPRNIQNSNAFVTGPDILWNLSPKSTLTLRPQFADFYFEDSDTDSRRYSVDADWAYQFFPQLTIGFGGSFSKVNFDNEDLNPNFTDKQVRMTLSGQRKRLSYGANIGLVRIDRDKVKNQKGMNANASILFDLTRSSKLEGYIASSLRDTGTGLLDSLRNPNTGDFNNEQITGDVLQDKIIRVGYNRRGFTLDGQIWLELRKDDYKEAPDDRSVQEIGTKFNYQVTALFSTGLDLIYRKTSLDDINRDNDDWIVGGRLNYRVSRRLSSQIGVTYNRRDSNLAGFDYSETGVFANLVYNTGNVSFSDTGYTNVR